MTVVLSTKTLVLPMQKRYQTQDIVKLVLKRTENCRYGGLPEKKGHICYVPGWLILAKFLKNKEKGCFWPMKRVQNRYRYCKPGVGTRADI